MSSQKIPISPNAEISKDLFNLCPDEYKLFYGSNKVLTKHIIDFPETPDIDNKPSILEEESNINNLHFLSYFSKNNLLDNISPSPFSPLLHSKENSLEFSVERSEVTLGDLERNLFGRSDIEDCEGLIDFEEVSVFAQYGGISMEKNMPDNQGEIKPFPEICSKKEVGNNVSPFKSGVYNQEGIEYLTPKKKGPQPIGIIIENDDRWTRCAKVACCENVSSNCLIS